MNSHRFEWCGSPEAKVYGMDNYNEHVKCWHKTSWKRVKVVDKPNDLK